MRLRLFPAALILAAAWSVTGAASFAACQMEKAATLPMQVENGLIFVPGAINGRAVRFLVDTTADSLILPNPAHDMQLFQILHPRDRSFMYVAEGRIGPVNVEELKVGELTLSNYIMHVLGRRADFGAPDQVAVLGRDFLKGYDVEFDAKAGRITLYKSSGCETANLAGWSERANAVGMLEGDDLLYYHIAEFRRYIPDMRGVFLPAKVNGADVVAILDSGSVQTSLSTTAAHTLGVLPAGPGVPRIGDGYSLINNRKLESWQAPVESVTLDQETIRPATLLVHRIEGADELTGTDFTGTRLNGRPIYTADLILGADFMLSHHVLVAYSQRRIYFTYEGGPAFHADAPSGIN
jgi:predicted aspartyl protease